MRKLRPETESNLRTKFIGRQGECELLETYLEEARNGSGKLVLVTGESGIGKTRLVHHIGKKSVEEGFLFLTGRCISHQHADPYLPFIDALRHRLKNRKGSAAHEGELPIGIVTVDELNQGGYANGLNDDLPLGLLPVADANGDAGAIDIQSQRDKMFNTISQLIIDTSKEMPLLLFLDDLQWADSATLQLLFYVTRNITSSRVLIVCAYRPEDLDISPGEVHPLTQTLRRMGQEKMYQTIHLGKMGQDEIADIVKNILDVEQVPEGFLKKLYDESDGNPFFIEEVLKSLMDEGIIRRHAHIWDAGVDLSSVRIPNSIKDVISHRIARMDEQTKKVLRFISVIGTSFQFDVLQRVTGISSEELLDILDHLIEIDIIHEDTTTSHEEVFVFNHKQTRVVIYEAMSKSRLRVMHHKVGETLEELYSTRLDDVVFQLARHFTMGKDFLKSYNYSRQAGEKAMRSFAFEDAIEYFESALRNLNFLDHDSKLNIAEEKLVLTSKIGNLYYSLGDWSPAITHFTEALKTCKTLGNRSCEAETYLYLGHTERLRGNYHKAEEMYEKALPIFEELEDHTGLAGGQRGLGYVHWRKGENDDAVEHYKESIGHSMKTGDKHGMAKTHIELGNVYNNWGDHEKAMEYYMKSIPHLEEVGDYNELARAYNNMGDSYLRTHDYEKALESFEKCKVASEKIGNKNFVAWALFNSAEALAYMGDYDKAEEFCNRAMKICEELDDKIGMNGVFKNLGIIYRFKEDWDKAIDNFNKSIVILEMLDIPYDLGTTYEDLGTTYEAMGEKEEAIDNYNMAVDLLEVVGAKGEVERIKARIAELEG